MTTTDADDDGDGDGDGFALYNSDSYNEVAKLDDVEILVLDILEGHVKLGSTNPGSTSCDEGTNNASPAHTTTTTRTTARAETIMQQQMENLWLARSEIQQQSSNWNDVFIRTRVVELLLQRNRRLYVEISNSIDNNIPALRYSSWIKCMKNVCGGWPCWLGANRTLRELSDAGSIAVTPSFKDDFPSITCLEITLQLLKILMFSEAQDADVSADDIDESSGFWNMFLSSEDETKLTAVLGFPNLVLQALHFCNKHSKACVSVPIWCEQQAFYQRLLLAALTKHNDDTFKIKPTSIEAQPQLLRLVQRLLRRRGGQDVAVALYQFYVKNVHSRSQLQNAWMQRLSSREAAILCRAILIKANNNKTFRPLHQEQGTTYNRWAWADFYCRALFEKGHSEAILHGIVLQKQPENRCRLAVDLAEFLHRTPPVATDKDGVEDFSDDDDSENPANSIVSLLNLNLCRAATIWSQAIFLRRTDCTVQRQVSLFLVAGVRLLAPKLDQSSRLALILLPGITERLGSTAPARRLEGMHVAKQLALAMGQELSFEELKEDESNDFAEALALQKAIRVSQVKESTENQQYIRGIPQSDPTTNYSSSDDTIDGDKNDRNDAGSVSTEYSDESDWGKDKNQRFISNDMEDDEEDLRETQRPLYLTECLDLLRSNPQDDEHAASRHETCLRELPRLVRAHPADLTDLGPELARSVLRLDNFFHLQDFHNLVGDSLQAFLVHDPLVIGPHLVEELFQDGSFSDREQVLLALQRSAHEMVGRRNNTNVSSLPNDPRALIQQKVEGSKISRMREESQLMHENTNENKTRRWGQSNHPTSKANGQNRFGSVAPVWYYALLSNFLRHKDDEALWGGTNGAMLLSLLFRTLGSVVDCTGPYTPGADVLAKDLLELVWAFRGAEISTVRSSALHAASCAVPLLRQDVLLELLLDPSSSNFVRNLHEIVENDPDLDCRQLASLLYTSVASTVQTFDKSTSPLLL